MSIYYADFEENYDSEDFTCAGFTFASDTFEYTFGRIRDDGPTNQEQYVGYGQNMIKFDPPSPKKRSSHPRENQPSIIPVRIFPKHGHMR
ncbi:MAG: hypothetical protein ACLVI9_12325 [Anaerostipes hadrus]